MKQQTDFNIKEIDMVSWQVIERIMLAFYEHGSLKKSQIASRSGLNYTSCMRYLRWLNEKMWFVKFEYDVDLKKINSIRLSSEGILFCKKRILVNDNLSSVKMQDTYLFA